MNNSVSSISTGGTAHLTNPLKEDPELKGLFKELETTVTSKKDFELWRNSFLNRFIEFLDVKSTENAEQAYWKFSDTMSNFVRVINKLNKHMDDNNISPTHCSVKARQSLQEVSRYINIVNDEVDHLLPGTINMEKEVGFTKFHIGAVLVRDGFREYARMSMCADVIEKMEKALKDVADKLILLNMNLFIYKLNTFCDVMADLGLLSALLKCSEYIDSDDDDEEPIKLSKLIENMLNEDNKDTEIEYPNLDLNASITLFDRSNVSMNYEEDDQNIIVPDPTSEELVLYTPPNGPGMHQTEDAMVPYSMNTNGTENRIQISGRPSSAGNSYPTFDPDSSITLLDRSNTSLDPSEHAKPLPKEFAPRESAPYGYVAPSSTKKASSPKQSYEVADRGGAPPKNEKPKDFAPRESAPYGYVAASPPTTAKLPKTSNDVVDSAQPKNGKSKEFAPRESAPYGYVAPSPSSTVPKPAHTVADTERAPSNKANPTGQATNKKSSNSSTDTMRPPTHSKPPLMRREPTASSTATPNKSTVNNKNETQSPAVSDTEKKPSIGGRVRWNPVKYYNNTKNKPESKKMEQVDTKKADTKGLENKKVEKVDASKQDAVQDSLQEANATTNDSSSIDEPKVEPEKKGLRALFQRKTATKASPSDPVEEDSEKVTRAVTEPIKLGVEEKEIAKPVDDVGDDADEEKPVQRRRQKWSFNDIYKRLAKNKKEPKTANTGIIDTNAEVPSEDPKSTFSNVPDAPLSNRNNPTANEPSIEPDDVSESSTMVSENEETVRQVHINSTTTPKSSKRRSASANPVNDENPKKRSTITPTEKEKPIASSKKADKVTNASSNLPESAAKPSPVQPEKDLSNKSKQAAKPSKRPSDQPNTTSPKQQAVKNDDITHSNSPKEPKRSPTKSKKAMPNVPPDRPTENATNRQTSQKGHSPTESSTRPEKESVISKKSSKADNAPTQNPENSAKKTQVAKKDNAPSTKPIPKHEKRSDKVPKRVQNNDFPDRPIEEPSLTKPTAEKKNKTSNNTKKVENLKKIEPPISSPDTRNAISKSEDRTKPLKPQKEKIQSKAEEKVAKNERNSKEVGSAVQEKKVPKKQVAKSEKKGIKNLFSRSKKNDQSNSLQEQDDEVVQRNRAPQPTEQTKPWDGVSPKMKESWDEKYTTKKKNGKGNEPLAICAAPPEDDEEAHLLTGGEPLLAICAADPDEDQASGSNGKPLLAICAAPDDDNDVVEAFSVDDVSESETMVSDDEGEEGVSESETVDSDDDDVKDVNAVDALDDIEPCADDVSESDTAASENDEVSAASNDDGDGDNIEEVNEDDRDTVTVTPTPHSYVDDVSESETANSDEGDNAVVDESTAMMSPDNEHLSAMSKGTPTSNQSIATSAPVLHEKSDVTVGQVDSTLETTKDKPDHVAKKEVKVLTDDERRKCYMWYDRMGRPTRDKMKHRIPLMKDCDITLEDVDALPWMMRGTMISQSELNKLILK